MPAVPALNHGFEDFRDLPPTTIISYVILTPFIAVRESYSIHSMVASSGTPCDTLTSAGTAGIDNDFTWTGLG